MAGERRSFAASGGGAQGGALDARDELHRVVLWKVYVKDGIITWEPGGLPCLTESGHWPTL